jgi:hypothetical protein
VVVDRGVDELGEEVPVGAADLTGVEPELGGERRQLRGLLLGQAQVSERDTEQLCPQALPVVMTPGIPPVCARP